MDYYNEFLDFCLENEITIDSQLHKTIKKLFENLNSNNIVSVVIMPDNEKKSIVALLLTLFLQLQNKRTLFYNPVAYWEDYDDYECIKRNKETFKTIAFANVVNLFADYRNESFDFVVSERLAVTDISSTDVHEARQRFAEQVRNRPLQGTKMPISLYTDLECVNCRIFTKIASRSHTKVILFLSLNELNNCKKTILIRTPRKAIISVYKKEELLDYSKQQKRDFRHEECYTQNLFDYLDKKFSRIESKIDDVGNKILEITDVIKRLQNRIADDKHVGLFLLEATDDEAQEENVIKNVVDIVSAHINEAMVSVEKENLFLRYHQLVEVRMGPEAWKKMGVESQKFLITAKLLFSECMLLGDNVDYSSICLLASKAIELELAKRFVTGYKAYIRNYLKDNYSKWPSCLIKQDKKGIIWPIDESDYMLGNSPYIMGILPRNSKEAEMNARFFGDYCKKELVKEEIIREIGLKSVIKGLNDQIWTIKDKYRNPAAHKNTISMLEASECIDYILEVERVMKRMLEMFNF